VQRAVTINTNNIARCTLRQQGSLVIPLMLTSKAFGLKRTDCFANELTEETRK